MYIFSLFFFSSRRRHTRLVSDWSSDVCSSDLRKTSNGVSFLGPSGASVWGTVALDPKRRAVYLATGNAFSEPDVGRTDARSEERRVGKECRSRWSRDHYRRER